MRAACTSSGPSPSTRTLARCGACVTATLEITEAVAVAPAGSCVCASEAPLANAELANIRQPIRMAGQFVFIAVLLHWRKFAYSPGVPQAFQTRLFRLHGRTRRPWQFSPRGRHTAGRLPAESTFALADSRPPRSSRSARALLHPTATCSPADLLCPEADSSLPPPLLAHGPPVTRMGRDARFSVLSPAQASQLRKRPAWAPSSAQPSSAQPSSRCASQREPALPPGAQASLPLPGVSPRVWSQPAPPVWPASLRLERRLSQRSALRVSPAAAARAWLPWGQAWLARANPGPSPRAK